MIDREDYIKAPSQYPANSAVSHSEHIIQNALYGRLTADDILCLSCGTKLSEQIDREFVKFFEGFTEPIKHVLATKDHGGKNAIKTLKGYILKKDGSKIEVQIRENKVTPTKPDYEYFENDNEIKIYTNNKVAKSYQKQVLKELKIKGIDTTSVKIEIIDNIQNLGELGINFSEGVNDFNTKFKMGINKIASGFAIASGIKRDEIPCTLDLIKGELIFTNNIVPFFPYGVLDLIIEPFRIVHESEFPTHTLILYTDSAFNHKKLVCYIDLFSTFQFYVILNHNYKGSDINKHYYQTIIKQEKPLINVRAIRWKHLSILANGLGVKSGEMAGMQIEEMYDFLEKKYRQYTVQYTLDLNAYFKYIGSKAATNFILKKNNLTSHLSPLEEEIMKELPVLENNDFITIYHEQERLEDENPSEFYRQTYLETDENMNTSLHSTLAKMIELNNTKFTGTRDYSHIKFYLLSHFIAQNEMAREQKIK